MTIQLDLVLPATTIKIDAEVTNTRIHVSGTALSESTGWVVKPEGFCLGDVCVPAGDAVDENGRVDLRAFAELTGHPLVIDLDESVLSLGIQSKTRGSALRSLHAPDFTLPDLAGKEHSLSDYQGKKILLAAYASW